MGIPPPPPTTYIANLTTPATNALSRHLHRTPCNRRLFPRCRNHHHKLTDLQLRAQNACRNNRSLGRLGRRYIRQRHSWEKAARASPSSPPSPLLPPLALTRPLPPGRPHPTPAATSPRCQEMALAPLDRKQISKWCTLSDAKVLRFTYVLLWNDRFDTLDGWTLSLDCPP